MRAHGSKTVIASHKLRHSCGEKKQQLQTCIHHLSIQSTSILSFDWLFRDTQHELWPMKSVVTSAVLNKGT